MSVIQLKIVAEDSWSKARATEFRTRSGVVETPIFMPVATQAAFRGVDSSVVHDLGYQVILANTYHLLLRPGPETFNRFGGIHNFMAWSRSVLTDSGGFQIFSLSKQLQLSEEGASFRSYVDGAQVLLTPEVSIATQEAIGSDIMMVLDHCINSTSDIATTREALTLTSRWAKRSFEARSEGSSQALFGIVQGACFKELRRESAAQITAIPFDGFALGGLAVGETKEEREDITEFTAPLLPRERPRYLMGVGTPIDLLEAVKRGIDMFDCIIPTSLALQGVCFTSTGRINLRRSCYRFAEAPLDPNCCCSTCQRFSKAYLSHLVRAGEFVADQLLSLHNLAFYASLMRRMRKSIIDGEFRAFYHAHRDALMAVDPEFPSRPPKRRVKRPDRILGNYEVVEHERGYGSIRQVSSGETMHSVSEPLAESRALYLEQSGVLTTLTTEGDPIVVWDVGLGAATNAMCLVLGCESLQTLARPIHLISFENDLDSLKLALKHPGLFEHLRHAAPQKLLEKSIWRNADSSIVWRLLHGDFSEKFQNEPAPDIIWFDPFSFRVDSDLWSVETFRRMFEHCGSKPARLYTYTNSTAVRAAMLAAGWYVGPGAGTGPKSETTVAYTPSAAQTTPPPALLGEAWLNRWMRSDAKQPYGDKSGESIQRIERHPQFSACRNSCKAFNH